MKKERTDSITPPLSGSGEGVLVGAIGSAVLGVDGVDQGGEFGLVDEALAAEQADDGGQVEAEFVVFLLQVGDAAVEVGRPGGRAGGDAVAEFLDFPLLIRQIHLLAPVPKQ